MLPDSVDKTTRLGHWLVADDTPLPDNFNDYMNNVLFVEDIALCESVQDGLRSQSYNQGPFMIDPDHSGISEIAVQHFHGLIQQALGDVGGNV
jgi:choline monooxygenase